MRPWLAGEVRVSVSVFGALRQVAGGAELQLSLAAGARVRDAIAATHLADRVDLWVLLDGRRVERDAPLSDGARLTFFQPVGGG